ncbi:MAG: type II toxin-antitoxin system Phd/YefM family antitoxin [Candidatus Viridilinea halotolerans]|uniref:Antitoxin n=1 Tax=Candidatus Viridilinea halotolerans TaxID=2491704 RepID=A0A426U8N7_9CHLR|nr:MAG: type II toxin-antitoxin system Phd/YefM family antitoxin [Candidatus Viridilinea halotolerans]
MSDLKNYTLDVDLKQGVVPISKAASSLAALIKRSRSNHQPIIVTQKGYPTGVILDVELFTALRKLADAHGGDELLELQGEVEEIEVEEA